MCPVCLATVGLLVGRRQLDRRRNSVSIQEESKGEKMKVVSSNEWLTARSKLLQKEK